MCTRGAVERAGTARPVNVNAPERGMMLAGIHH
ncbi:VOC family protein, partial [Xanthomonas perforans]